MLWVSLRVTTAKTDYHNFYLLVKDLNEPKSSTFPPIDFAKKTTSESKPDDEDKIHPIIISLAIFIPLALLCSYAVVKYCHPCQVTASATGDIESVSETSVDARNTLRLDTSSLEVSMVLTDEKVNTVNPTSITD